MPARRGLLESPEASCSLRFRLYGVADTEARADARPQRREVLAEGCFNSHDILAFKRQPCGRALAINVVRHPASCSCAPVRGSWGRAWGTQHSSALNWNLPGDSLDPALLGPFPSGAAGRDESGNIYATGPLRPGSGNGCIALTNRAFVVVTIGEPKFQSENASRGVDALLRDISLLLSDFSAIFPPFPPRRRA